MSFSYFSHNGEVLTAEQAVVPLSNIEYSYGYGVYESVRVSKGKTYFLDEHAKRLMGSAKVIGLDHPFSASLVKSSIEELVAKNKAETCNVKVLLLGGVKPSLYILCLNPFFPDRKLYKTGVACTTYEYEREFPGAKTLNMLSSYIAYKRAKEAGAYDALLVNRKGAVTEGTRTNLFALKDRAITSPPEEEILPGVTRMKALKVARQKGFNIVEKDIKLDEISQFDSLFITSTSDKILPVNMVGDTKIGAPAPALLDLMSAFDDYLSGL
jgi:branched-chain amino acid aminotransferase